MQAIERKNSAPQWIQYALALTAFLIFAALGAQWITRYSLWDDEANTALLAQSVRETGDTSAVRGSNLIAYRGGAELNDSMKARYVSPLQYYFLAPFIEDSNAPSARYPFFVLTLISLALMYRRLFKLKLPTRAIALFSCLSLGLISFLLFGVQSRYYALTFLFSLLAADAYLYAARPLVLGLFTALVFISNYLVGVAVLGAMAAHSLLFRRERLERSIKKWITILIPHLLISAPVFWIWNPLGKKVVTIQNTLFDRCNLLFRNFRDFNGGELGSLVLLALGLVIFKSDVRHRFKQYAVVLVTYLVMIAALSPQPVRATGQADIRYLYPLMLVSFCWTLDFLLQLNHLKQMATVIVFCFLSLPYNGRLQVPLADLVRELVQPADDPYHAVSRWLNTNAVSGARVQSTLDYALYPLMFEAPSFKYIGQMRDELSTPADVIIDFCTALSDAPPPNYWLSARFEIACREAYRPEVFLRSFGQNQSRGIIRIWKRIQETQ